jgi:hypothetical protein
MIFDLQIILQSLSKKAKIGEVLKKECYGFMTPIQAPNHYSSAERKK